MQTDDFFRARIDAMINLSDPMAVLATRIDWAGIETSLVGKFERRERAGEKVETRDLFGMTQRTVGAGASPAGRPRLPIRLMVVNVHWDHGTHRSAYGLLRQNPQWRQFIQISVRPPESVV